MSVPGGTISSIRSRTSSERTTSTPARRSLVAARAEASPRLRRTAERRLADQAELEILRHRIDQLELRLAALEQHAAG